MRKYETVFISDPDLSDQGREELFERVKNIIDKENGILLNVDQWGLKKLSYEIKKKLRGYYTCVTYGGTGELVTELERNFRLSDLIMKFMTILVTEHVTEESLRQEAEEAKEAAKQAEESAPKPKEESAPQAKEEAAPQEKEEAVPQAKEEEKAQEDAEEKNDKAEESADDQNDAQETESEKTSEETPKSAEESKE